MKLTESQITAQIRQLLKLLHVFHWKQWQGALSQPKGVSDILGIYKGRFLAIEVKSPTGKLTAAQERFLENVKEEGGIAIVARSYKDVIDGLGVGDRFKSF